MSERTLVSLGTLSLRELKARSRAGRLTARGRISTLSLPIAFGIGVTVVVFPLSLTLCVGMNRSGWACSQGDGRRTHSSRTPAIRTMHVVALGTVLALTLLGPLSTMLTQVGRSSRGSFLILSLTPKCNLSASLHHKVGVRTHTIIAISSIVIPKSMLRTSTVPQPFKEVISQDLFIDGLRDPSKVVCHSFKNTSSFLSLGHLNM